MSGVLSGVRVVELASWTYVPAAGVALADWGADVIKVESVVGGDPGRALVVGGFTRQAARADTDFILELSNRGKRSIALDLKTDTGREFFGRLLAEADVLLTNWLPGALERARLTVEDIRAFNPNIIIARGTGLGVRGPDRNRGGFDAATYGAPARREVDLVEHGRAAHFQLRQIVREIRDALVVQIVN
ncbi:MAG TPA: CoA transferase, partial [Mycobacterium sp.]